MELFKVIKPKVGKRVPRPVQKVSSTFRDDYAPSDEEEEEESSDSEFDDEVITKVTVGEGRECEV